VNAVWAAAGTDARLQDVARVLTARGHSLDTATERRAAIQDLLASVARVREEAAALAEELEAQRRMKDATASFAERSRVFRTRGLSADSSVLTQFAVDRSVCALGDRAVLTARSVNRVAIVGPGLDFVDKQEGFDFYEPQSLQPFTLADSLLQCGLATRNTLSITTIDISPRVNGHLRAAVRRANDRRAAYRLVLPWNPDNVSGEATAYWKRAGAQVGRAFTAPAPRGMPGVLARGIAVSPEIVSRIQPVDASIVSDRLALSEERHFDFVLASNVLVYYDTFEQTLALASVAAMLRPGGVLLTNDAVLEIPEVPLRSTGSVAVPFSDRPGDGERMVWYVKSSGGR
jgi:SAM-dependent methyltransferase